MVTTIHSVTRKPMKFPATGMLMKRKSIPGAAESPIAPMSGRAISVRSSSGAAMMPST